MVRASFTHLHISGKTLKKNLVQNYGLDLKMIKAAYSVTMNVFRFFFYFLFKSLVKVEISCVSQQKCSVQLKTAWKSELSYQIGVFFSCW